MSNYSLAMLVLLAVLAFCFVWTAAGFATGIIIPVSTINWLNLARDLALATASFALLILAAFLPMRRAITAQMVAGSGLFFFGVWHLLVRELVAELPSFMNAFGAITFPLGVALLAAGVYQMGRAYRLSRLLLGSYRKIEHSLSTQDQLTQLFNRRYFYSACPDLLASCQKHSEPCTLIALYIKNLPDINQRLGVGVGDAVLSELGRAIINNTRSVDISARLSGRRLALFLPDTDSESAGNIIARMTDLTGRVQVTDNSGERRFVPLELECGLCQAGEEENFESLVERCLHPPLGGERDKLAS